VGLENPDAKEELFSPVEESPESNRALNDQDTRAEQNPLGQGRSERAFEEERQAAEDQALIRRLSARDAEVRAHEAAHSAVGGQFAGSPSFTFQRGPDGVDYAIGGEVRISIPQGGASPEATLRALEQVQAAALAPAEPSEQDRQVAAQAASQAAELRVEIQVQEQEERQEIAEQEEAERQETREAEKEREEQERLDKEREAQRLAREESIRTNALLGDELITNDNLARNDNAGLIFDQLA